MFRYQDLYPSSGEESEAPTILDPFEEDNVVFSSLLEFRTIHSILNPTDSD
jgi:hypothetical protein